MPVIMRKNEKRNNKIYEFSALSSRMINIVLEGLMKGNGWNFADLAYHFGEDCTEEKLRRHFYSDSQDSYTIARLCEIFHLPTQPARQFMDGTIVRELKKQKDIRGMSYAMLIKKIFPKITSEKLPTFVDRIQKFFENSSRDAWVIALLCDFFGLPTLPPHWFLNKDDFENPKTAEQLEFWL